MMSLRRSPERDSDSDHQAHTHSSLTNESAEQTNEMPIGNSADPDLGVEATNRDHATGQTLEHVEADVEEPKTEKGEVLASPNSSIAVTDFSHSAEPAERSYISDMPSHSTSSILHDHSSSSTITEDEHTSTEALQSVEFVEIAPTHDIIDLTHDDPYEGPSYVPQEQVVKREPDDDMALFEPVSPSKQPQFAGRMLDEPDPVAAENYFKADCVDLEMASPNLEAELTALDTALKAEYALPDLDGDDSFWQINPEERAAETEDAMSMILAAASSFRASLPMDTPSVKNNAPAADIESSGSPAGKSSRKSRPKSPIKAVKGGIRKTTRRPNRSKSSTTRGQKPSTMNFISLLSNDLIAIAQSNQSKESQPTFTSKKKATALSELISSMPKEQQKLHSVDKKELEMASRKFNGIGAMKADGAGGWKLKGMKSSLHHYQLLGAAFMRDLENRASKPFGGFVADDMGLGKTVINIANIIDGRPSLESKAEATLVVAPSSLLAQWMAEFDKHAEPGRVGRVLLYRTSSSLVVSDVEATLNHMGVVITSYHEVLRSWPKNDPPPQLCTDRAKSEWWARECTTNIGPLHRIQWRRVILDEAQAIKNHQSRTSEAVCQLKSKYRWAVTGSPCQNSLQELYACFKFLDLPHTGSYKTFRKNFCKQDSELAINRLRQYLDQFMLRRTHADTIFGRPILKLPDIKSKTITVKFNTIERTIYRIVKDRFIQKITAYVRAGSVEKKYQSIFALLLRLRQLTCHCFLVQNTFKKLLEEADLERLWKLTEDESSPENQKMIQGLKFTLGNATADAPQAKSNTTTSSPTAFRFRKYLQSMRKDGKWAEIIDKTLCTACKDPPEKPHITSCNHIYCYGCLNQMSWNVELENDKNGSQCIECGSHFNRTEPCSREDLMTPESGSPVSIRSGMREGAALDVEESTDWFTIGGPIPQSAKTKAAVSQIEQWRQEDNTAKIIVFTQFRGMIKVMQRICQERRWGCTPFHGSMSFDARDKAMKTFAKDPKCGIMLCGLKAGGVGLNLTAANRVIIIDLWWNQSVETQAFCRIYRIGQEREVEMVRFIVNDSIDEEIICMQERKNAEIDQAMDTKNRPRRLSAKELLQLFDTDLERDANGEPIAGPNEEPFILTEDPYQQTSYNEYQSD